MKVEKILNATK